ncbi:MAG: histidine kinase [Mucilaginibacter polytrichastri]|nr:histidine kinase [Mucilaginibacter polytrichastri]
MRILIILISFLHFANRSHAQAIDVEAALKQSYIGKSIDVFQDADHHSFAEISRQPDLFKRSTLNVPNFGLTENNNWIRFQLVNPSSAKTVILNLSNPLVEDCMFYVVRASGVDSLHLTNLKSIDRRIYRHQFYLFDLPLAEGETVTCYLRIRSDNQILAPLSISEDRSLFTVLGNFDTRAGIYFGIMLVMLVYNLFLFFTIRDRDYIVYCHYIFWVALTQATLLGYGFRYLWTNNEWLNENMVVICGVMSGIATILFAQSFLRVRVYTPRLRWALNGTIVMYLIALSILFMHKGVVAYGIVNFTAALVSILIMITAWIVYRQNYYPARFFLLSWSIFFASILVFVAKDYDIVPYNQFTVHSVEIGSALEAVFLSFALAGKINILKKEKEVSQAQALSIAEENERIIKEQNVLLEQKVDERTFELKEANTELNSALFNLKKTQNQLVESEKMASLGQLTAGIAHEINNPINFVTANISPLQRDINMLLTASEEMENIGLSSDSVEVKRSRIDAYKEELDFDYLKMEIRQLLKGMYEGASRTAEIVKGLRIFSREDDDGLKKANINESIDSTLIILNNIMERIRVDKQYGVLSLMDCYPGKLNQVFLNIITNSIHALKKKFREGEGGILTIETVQTDHHIRVTLKDNATGMEESTKRRLFDPFFTTKDVGEGTGLGMYISYNIINKHEGDIVVNTELNVGTEFIITLPTDLKERQNNSA